jgi:hypothetical protein
MLGSMFTHMLPADVEVPEEAIAFDEKWVRRLYESRGLKVVRLDYGSWCGRENYVSYQDLMLAVKT